MTNSGITDLISRAAALEVIEAVKNVSWSQSGKVLCSKMYSQIKDIPAVDEEQEPRVMTLEKAQTALHNDDVVWVELKDKIICGGIRMDGTDYFTMQNGDVLDVTDFDSEESAEMYGKEVRCWTSRPSEAQREAVKWE